MISSHEQLNQFINCLGQHDYYHGRLADSSKDVNRGGVGIDVGICQSRSSCYGQCKGQQDELKQMEQQSHPYQKEHLFKHLKCE